MNKEMLSEKQIRWFTDSLNCCKDIKRMFKSILGITKMKEGRLELVKKITKIVKLTNNLLSTFMGKMEEKHISLSHFTQKNITISTVMHINQQK